MANNLITKVREESYIYTGYSYPIELMEIVEFNFKGNRQKIRYASVEKAIDLISSII